MIAYKKIFVSKYWKVIWNNGRQEKAPSVNHYSWPGANCSYFFGRNRPRSKLFKCYNGQSGKGPTLISYRTTLVEKKRSILDIWNCSLKYLWHKSQSQFFSAVRKQTGKMRTGEQHEITLEESIGHLKANSENTLSIDVSALQIPLICIDIDNPNVGRKIIDIFTSPNIDDFVIPVLGCPWVVKTETLDHVHLYYKAPPVLTENHTTFKKTLPTRLGFKAEYIFGVVTVAGQKRQPIFAPPFRQISVLPQSLFPYNFPRNDSLFELFSESVNKEDNKKAYHPLTEGERNNKLFSFLKVANFGINHYLLTNKLCCHPPLPFYEVKKSNSSIKAFQDKQKIKHAYITTFEISTINPRVGRKNFAPEFVDEANERILKAKEKKTPMESIEFVFYVESNYKIQVPDEEWMGLSIERVLIYYLLSQKFVNIKHVVDGNTWLVWNGRYWQTTSENEVVELLYQRTTKLRYGGLENKINRHQVLQPLKDLCSEETWPAQMDVVGYSFKNKLVYYDNNELKTFDHDPDKKHRVMFNADYQKSGKLSLETLALISDLCHGNQHSYHLFRLMGYLSLISGFGNLGFYLFGTAGGAKSTVVHFFKSLFPRQAVGAVDDAVLRKSMSVKSTLVKGRNLIIMHDMTAKSFSSNTLEFLKQTSGRDDITSDRKYQDQVNFLSEGRIIITSNVPPSGISAFKDTGFKQRFVPFSVPGVNSEARINNIGHEFEKNKNELTHFFMSIDKRIVEKSIRADSVTSVTDLDLSDTDLFIIERLVFQKGEKLTSKALGQAFVSFKKDLGDFNENHPIDYTKIIAMALTDYNQKLLPAQQIVKYRTTSERGFLNLTTLSQSGKLKENQERFVLKKDMELKELLDQSPLIDHGFCYYNSKTGLVQVPPESKETEIHNTLLTKAIHEAGVGVGHVVKNLPCPTVPFEHLSNNLVESQNATKLKETDWYNVYPIISLKDKNDPTKLINRAEFEKNVEKLKQELFEKDQLKQKQIATENLVNICLKAVRPVIAKPIPEKEVKEMLKENKINLVSACSFSENQKKPLGHSGTVDTNISTKRGRGRPKKKKNVETDPKEETSTNSKKDDANSDKGSQQSIVSSEPQQIKTTSEKEANKITEDESMMDDQFTFKEEIDADFESFERIDEKDE